MKFPIIVFVLVSSFPIFSLDYKYGKAISAVQAGKLDEAHSTLLNLMVDSAERPDVLYDLGVVSYKKNDFKGALTYFNRAAEYAQDTQLKEQALFNYANSCVGQNALHDAVEGYEKVLHLNKDNARAQHNLEVVKRMLQEQDKQKNQQSDDSKEDERSNNNEQNDPQNKKQDDSNESSDSSSGSENDQQGKQQNKNRDQSYGSKKGNEKGNKNSQVGDQDKSKGGNQGAEGKDPKQVPNNTGDQKRNHKIEQHEGSPSSNNTSNSSNTTGETNTPEKQKSQEKESNPTGFMGKTDKPSLPPSEQWMSTLLDSQEHADKNANKQFVRLLTRSQSAGEAEHDKSW